MLNKLQRKAWSQCKKEQTLGSSCAGKLGWRSSRGGCHHPSLTFHHLDWKELHSNGNPEGSVLRAVWAVCCFPCDRKKRMVWKDLCFNCTMIQVGKEEAEQTNAQTSDPKYVRCF